MDELIYSNQLSSELNLYVSTASDDVYWSAFLAESVPAGSPSCIRFCETFRYEGYYLFAYRCPTGCSDLVKRISPLLFPLKGIKKGGIVWIPDADGDINKENLTCMYFQSDGEGLILMSPFNFHIGNNFATLTLTSGAKIDCGSNRFVFSWLNDQHPVEFNTNLSFSVESYGRLEIPVCGKLTGSIRFPAESKGNFKCFSALDTSIKFFYPDKNGLTNEISCPAFQEEAYGNIKFQFSINPLDLLNATALNSYMAFLGISHKNGTDIPTVLKSCYRSDYGIPFNLIPEPNFIQYENFENVPDTNSPMIVLSERKKGSTELSWYTVPSGGFKITVDDEKKKYLDSSGQVRLLCGLSGTETISITAGTEENGGDYLIFKAGQPAYIPQFPVKDSKNKIGKHAVAVEMNDTYRTVWVGFGKSTNSSASVIYHSQPQGNALFRTSQNSMMENGKMFMDFYPANSGDLGKTEKTVFFPMLIYGPDMIVPPKMEVPAFETQIMIPVRKTCLEEALKKQMDKRNILCRRPGSSNEGTPLIDSVTPQGYYIQIAEETGTWEKMQLASNRFTMTDGALSSVFTLEFKGLGSIFQMALQTNQLFLVVSSNANGVLGEFLNEMQLDGWPFIINVPEPETTHWNNGKYENVLIFKYCDQTLLERVRNTQCWTNSEAFNDKSFNGLANLSDWLTEYIEDGINKYEQQEDADYYKFRNIATNPAWKGIIALKVNISLATFPHELQGLLGGIDLNGFYAHHFGIDASTVKMVDNKPVMSTNSSMFALIDYEDTVFRQYHNKVDTYRENVPINDKVDYEFRVLSLKVAFTNSCISNFNSYIAFTINKLFGEKVKNANRENLLILVGTYEKQDEVPSYTFNVEGNNLMELDGKVIRSVEIVKTDFVTSVAPNTEEIGSVEAVFSFFGYIDFYPLDGFDLLSFGREDGDVNRHHGLAFLNMQVALDFPLDSPTKQTYGFSIDQMSFDLGTTFARTGSLYSHFPLQLTAIVSGTKEDLPAGREFLNVELPSLQQRQSISDDWYGLVFKLDMGTLGALASNAGFNAQFMAAWEVGGTGVIAGLKLPGTNPKIPVLNLQGIVKLNIKTIRIDIADDGVSYLMKLNNITLKFLSLTFPSKGQVDFFLFGNPKGKSTDSGSCLGWYGGYKKK